VEISFEEVLHCRDCVVAMFVVCGVVLILCCYRDIRAAANALFRLRCLSEFTLADRRALRWGEAGWTVCDEAERWQGWYEFTRDGLAVVLQVFKATQGVW